MKPALEVANRKQQLHRYQGLQDRPDAFHYRNTVELYCTRDKLGKEVIFSAMDKVEECDATGDAMKIYSWTKKILVSRQAGIHNFIPC